MQRDETTAATAADRWAHPLPPRLLAIEGVGPLYLEVAEIRDLSPHLRRVLLANVPADFAHRPGQDVMLVLGGTPERPLSRRYSIRRHDAQAGTLELNVVSHGVSGPGSDWVAATRPGDRINGVGPRGKIFLKPDADWHLLIGDESAGAATLAMLEAVPAGQRGFAYLEVPGPEDAAGLGAADGVHWIHRGETSAWLSTRLVEAMQSADLPAGRGHVYIFGEVGVINAVQRAALARGLTAEQISPKAYWGRGKANANNGEPEKTA
ncbi:MAG TPA: siderophore-interacting protein [Chloroflexota bacterium]|jgi:NADPH-dependent ferric siderophore reductase